MSDEASTEMALVYCPCPSLDEAKRLGHRLIEKRLAGCVNILPGMLSIYDWKGAREESQEAVLIAKTTLRAAGRVRELLEGEHPYETPAILTLRLADVNPEYLSWLVAGIDAAAVSES